MSSNCRVAVRCYWMVLVVDKESKKIIDNVATEDDILDQRISNIEILEDRREPNPDMDAIYIVSPQPHIIDCLAADFECRRYRSSFLLFTGLLENSLKRRLETAPGARQVSGLDTLPIDFFARESHLVTFRDPWSFPVLFHPDCNKLVRQHMEILARKIMSVCVAMGEYPKVRYYRPPNPTHEASVLCTHLARFVQDELDNYANYNRDFPPPTSRAPSTLIITDRSMDLFAPLVHEFTYQAMAHDLLPIEEKDKVTYHLVINGGTREQEDKDMELQEKDKVWVDNRHRHMKDTIDKLMGDFRRFLEDNPHFADNEKDTTSLNAIKDMLAGLPQFQEMKEAYSLHLNMAQECMNLFQRNKLPDVASVEQSLATGLDEDGRKPRNILDQAVRLLDDESIAISDRLRIIIMYVLYRDGVIFEDVKRLLAHASLPSRDGEVIENFELLGARPTRGLKETRPPPQPLFPPPAKPTVASEEFGLSRFLPVLHTLLTELSRGTLDQAIFPYVRAPADPNEDLQQNQGGSLRAGRPNWATTGRRTVENRQRFFVFMAGGATYSESRACYDVSNQQGKDIYLITSHMITPQLFIRQVNDLSADRRKLDLPLERPKPKAPAHLFERGPPVNSPPLVGPPSGSQGYAPSPPAPSSRGPAPMGNPGGGPARNVRPPPVQSTPSPGPRNGSRPPPPQGGLPSRPVPLTQKMGAMSFSGSSSQSGPSNGSVNPYNPEPSPPPPSSQVEAAPSRPNKLEKKRRNFLGMKK